MAKKTYQVGPISFTEAGYKDFTQKTKKEQVEQVTNSLNPKDPKKALKLLTHIPHGDISGGNDEAVAVDNTADVAPGGSKVGGRGQRESAKGGEKE
jgi:hypothetical protein